MSSFRTLTMACLVISIFLGANIGFCAGPPAGRVKLFLDVDMKITVPQQIVAYPKDKNDFKEDSPESVKGFGEQILRATPGTPIRFWYVWGDGSKSDEFADPYQVMTHTWTESGVYTISLVIRYTKRQYSNLFSYTEFANYEEVLATKQIWVTVHDVDETGRRIYCQVKCSVSEADENTKVTFTGELFPLDYATAIPEPTNHDPDWFSGVRPGSVEYQWKIIRKNSLVIEYEDSSWKTIPGFEKTVKPLEYTFPTPLDPEKYKVILNVRFRELRWKAIYNKGVVISYQDPGIDLTKDPYLCPEVPLGGPLRKAGEIVSAGQTPLEILIKDTTPAQASIEEGPTIGTTGDPLPSWGIIIKVTDNNPNADFSLPSLNYDYYIEGSKKTQNNDDTTTIKPPEILRPVNSKSFVDPKTSDSLTGSRARFFFEFGRAENYKTRMPDDYAVTMPDFGNPGSNLQPLKYFATIQVQDGGSKKPYPVKSDEKMVTVTDNDAPGFKLTFKTDPSACFKIERGVRDLPGNPAKIDLELPGETFKDADDPFKKNPPTPLEVVSSKYSPTVYVGQRIQLVVEPQDNVDGSAIKKYELMYTLDGSKTIVSNDKPFFLVEKMPNGNPLPFIFSVTDQAGNQRTILLNLIVKELKFEPRVLDTTIESENHK